MLQPVQAVGPTLDFSTIRDRVNLLLSLVQAYRLLAVMSRSVPLLPGRNPLYNEIARENSMCVSGPRLQIQLADCLALCIMLTADCVASTVCEYLVCEYGSFCMFSIVMSRLCCWYRVVMEGTTVFQHINKFEDYRRRQKTSLAAIQKAYKAADRAASVAKLAGKPRYLVSHMLYRVRMQPCGYRTSVITEQVNSSCASLS